MTQLEHAILERWSQGQSAGQIRRELQLARNRVSDTVVWARARGDARAVHHFHRAGAIVGRYRHRPPLRGIERRA